MRLLQTSVDESLESDDAEEPTTGYIFPCSGKKVIKAVKKGTFCILEIGVLHGFDHWSASLQNNLLVLNVIFCTHKEIVHYVILQIENMYLYLQ